MQRLVQKEKLVLQLQSELDNLKSSNPVELRESVRFSRIPMRLRADFRLHSPIQQNRMNELSANERKPSGLALWMKSPSSRLRSVSHWLESISYSLSSISKGNGSRKYYLTERQRATLLEAGS